MAQRRPSILTVSSVNMDLVLQAERVPVAGETLIGSAYHYVPGGKGANQAVAAARLGAEVTFVGKVGQDAHGAFLKRRLEEEGVRTSYLKVDSERATGLAVILLEASGENRILVYPSANLAIETAQVQAAFEEPYDAAIVNLETSDAIVIEVVRQARARGIPAILDAGPARPFDLTQVRGLEVLSPNETEAEALTGMPCRTQEQARQVARRLAEISEARSVVLKMGDQGAMLYMDGETEFFPAYAVEVVDTTAAGDAFTGALAFKYVQTGDLRRSIPFANAVGALTVTKLGAQPSLPTAEEVKRFAGERNLTFD